MACPAKVAVHMCFHQQIHQILLLRQAVHQVQILRPKHDVIRGIDDPNLTSSTVVSSVALSAGLTGFKVRLSRYSRALSSR